MAGIEHRQVDSDEAGMRLDRWFKGCISPDWGFGPLQKLAAFRTDPRGRGAGKIRHRHTTRARRSAFRRSARSQGSEIRPDRGPGLRQSPDGELLWRACAAEDAKVIVLNKPAGLAVQGGSGVNRHIDKMLEAWTTRRAKSGRLVHRLDRDTSGVLVGRPHRVGRSQPADRRHFGERDTQRTYWPVRRAAQAGRQDFTCVVKEPTPDGRPCPDCKHGENGADHAISITDRRTSRAEPRLAGNEPYTGRTHQLRGPRRPYRHPISGRSEILRSRTSTGPSRRHARTGLHLHARPHRHSASERGRLKITLPAPAHGAELNLLGLRRKRAGEEE